jgi:hypothetical protein
MSTDAPKPVEKVFGLKEAKEKCLAIRKHVQHFAGKPKHNPYTWIRDNLLDHERNLDNDKLQGAAILAIKNLPSEPTPSSPVPAEGENMGVYTPAKVEVKQVVPTTVPPAASK